MTPEGKVKAIAEKVLKRLGAYYFFPATVAKAYLILLLAIKVDSSQSNVRQVKTKPQNFNS